MDAATAHAYHELLQFLGPAAEELSSEQVDRLTREADIINARYHPDRQDERDAALSAAVQYLLGDTTVREVGEERRRTLDAEKRAKAAAIQVGTMAIQDAGDDDSERRIATEVGIDRQTLRKRLGKQ